MIEAWSVTHLDVILGLAGDNVLKIATTGHTIADVYRTIDRALGGSCIFSVSDGESNVLDMNASSIRGPVQVVVHRPRAPCSYSLGDLLFEVGRMDGSEGCNRTFCGQLELDQFPMLRIRDFYNSVFGKFTKHGYVVQARILELHTIFGNVSDGESPAKKAVLSRLCSIDRKSAIRKLIYLHNTGKIDLDWQRFENPAEEVGMEIRRR
jgi:hypothetical protein